FGAIVHAVVSALFGSAHFGTSIGARLDADGIHQVAVVLVDGCIADVGRCAGDLEVVGGNHPFFGAGCLAIAAVHVGAAVVDVHGMTGLEVAPATARVQNGHVVQVHGRAIGVLTKPNDSAVVEQRAVPFFDVVELPNQVRELGCMVAVDGQ